MIKYRKNGNAWVGILFLLIFLTTLGLALITDSIQTITQAKRSAQTVTAQSLCDAGIEKAIWELNNNSNYIGEEGLTLPTGIVDIIYAGGNLEVKNFEITSYVPDKLSTKVRRKIRVKIATEKRESNFSFHYGIQVGETGISMSNNSKVIGSVYSGGSISGGNGAYIMGDVYISGVGKSISNVRVGCPSSQGYSCPIAGNAYVDVINNSYIYGDAYYKNISNSTVLGTSNPGSETPQPIDLPILDTTIEEWKSWADDGEIYNGNYTISGTNNSLGPIKINGDLTVTNNGTLNITGAIWVTGNIEFSNNAIIKLDSSFGSNSGMLIADGQVNTSNNVSMMGSGNSNSYIMILSTSSLDPAIDVANNSSSVVYYAKNGFVDVSNNAHIKSITGHGIRLKNGAIVEYDTGLANSNFSAGPGGSWILKEWQVIH